MVGRRREKAIVRKGTEIERGERGRGMVGSRAARSKRERLCRGRLADRFSRSSRVETMLQSRPYYSSVYPLSPYVCYAVSALLCPKVVLLVAPLSLSLCFRLRSCVYTSRYVRDIHSRDVCTHTCGERATKVRIIGAKLREIWNFNPTIGRLIHARRDRNVWLDGKTGRAFDNCSN